MGGNVEENERDIQVNIHKSDYAEMKGGLLKSWIFPFDKKNVILVKAGIVEANTIKCKCIDFTIRKTSV